MWLKCVANAPPRLYNPRLFLRSIEFKTKPTWKGDALMRISN